MFVGVRERLGLYGAGSLTSRPNRVPRASRNGPRRWTLRRSDLGIEIEERFQAGVQLLFDIFLAALEYVHGDVGFPAIREFHGSLPHLGHILRRQQPHAVDQRQICHGVILRRLSRLPRTRIVWDLEFRAFSFRIPECLEKRPEFWFPYSRVVFSPWSWRSRFLRKSHPPIRLPLSRR